MAEIATEGTVELRFDRIEIITQEVSVVQLFHLTIITNKTEAASMILSNGSIKAIRYSGIWVGERGLQAGRLRQKLVDGRWEDDSEAACYYSPELHTLKPGESARFVFPLKDPPGEWRTGIELEGTNIIWSATLPPMLVGLKKPNHAVEPTRAPEGARGSP